MFRRRSRFLRPSREKNYVQFSAVALAAGVDTVVQNLAVASKGSFGANNVDYPSKIKAIYLEFSIVTNLAESSARVSWAIFKNPGQIYTIAQMSPSNLEGTNLTGSVIRAGQMQTPPNGAYAFAGWVQIPRRHQVFNETDTLTLVANAATASTACGICIYKHGEM